MANQNAWVDPPIADLPKAVPSDIVQVPGIQGLPSGQWGLTASMVSKTLRKNDFPLDAPAGKAAPRGRK